MRSRSVAIALCVMQRGLLGADVRKARDGFGFSLVVLDLETLCLGDMIHFQPAGRPENPTASKRCHADKFDSGVSRSLKERGTQETGSVYWEKHVSVKDEEKSWRSNLWFQLRLSAECKLGA